MPKHKLPLWWGYLDTDGHIHIKRYTDDAAIMRCEQMPFCAGIFDPFYAPTFGQARAKIIEFLDEQQGKEARKQ